MAACVSSVVCCPASPASGLEKHAGFGFRGMPQVSPYLGLPLHHFSN